MKRLLKLVFILAMVFGVISISTTNLLAVSCSKGTYSATKTYGGVKYYYQVTSSGNLSNNYYTETSFSGNWNVQNTQIFVNGYETKPIKKYMTTSPYYKYSGTIDLYTRALSSSGYSYIIDHKTETLYASIYR